MKMAFRPTSLWQRTLFFILVPTFLLLLGVSAVCYVFVRNLLLNQWGETAIAELQRTAHEIDMRLRQPKDLLNLLKTGKEPGGVDHEILVHILQQIEGLEGVVGVNLNKPDNDQRALFSHDHSSTRGAPHFHVPGQLTIDQPRYNHLQENRTVSLIAEFRGDDSTPRNRVEVILSFDLLIAQVLEAPWWKNNKAFLIDESGKVLASTSVQSDSQLSSKAVPVFGIDNPLERDTLAAMAGKDFGTVFGEGTPPKEISGFYRLAEAPWTMVIIAPGHEILRPITRFKLLYVISFAVCIPLILLLILGVTNRITARIKALSAAANNLANGYFGPPLAIDTVDEVGELTSSFNKMTNQLRQRLVLQEAMNIAREVQQNLLPLEIFAKGRVTAGGTCLYCDETGGDYFDILRFDDDDRRVGVAVGDVVGHGIGAALLMTTVRALLRSRVGQFGDLGRIIDSVNRLLCLDTVKSGNFVTLFYLEVDCDKNSIAWVRCGHEPAIVYSPTMDKFSELSGEGVALGVMAEVTYQCNEIPLSADPHCILIYSDGAWEVENEAGEQFGRERLKRCLAAYNALTLREMLASISENINAFRGSAPQQDDITLAVVKIS